MVRAWPRVLPDRPHVVDRCERVLTDGCEYSGVVGLGDVVVLDWDIAVDPDELRRFAACCADRVRVAPYRKYDADGWVWAHRRVEGDRWRRIRDGEPVCDRFGFGLVYLPGVLVDAFAASGVVPFDDAQFSEWHHTRFGGAAIDWGCRPVHLNHERVML